MKNWTHLSDIEIPNIDAEIGNMIGNSIPDAYTPIEVRLDPIMLHMQLEVALAEGCGM